MNPLLESIITQFSVQAQELLDLLEAKRITPKVWRDRMAALLATYHTAAMMTGIQSTAVPPEGWAVLAETLASQYGYLNNFYTQVAAAEAFSAAWRVRADMYADSSQSSYWDGYIYNKAGKFLPIPAVPGDGTTQCLTRDRCKLRVVKLGENDFDVYWELDRGIPDDQHCQTCLERGAQWYPLRIRDGVLMETAVKDWDTLTDEIIEHHHNLWERMASDDAQSAVPT